MSEEFQPGDLVRVIAPDYDEQEDLIDDVGFNHDMETEIGNIFRVVSCFTSHSKYTCYNLVGSEWTWAHEWLELVESSDKPTKLTDEDFDSIFNC